MRPDVFADSYKRFKSGTNAIAVWLVETAQSCKSDEVGKKCAVQGNA